MEANQHPTENNQTLGENTPVAGHPSSTSQSPILSTVTERVDFESKWDDIRKYYREASTQLSAITRQLALGGIALAWFFRTTNAATGHVRLPTMFAAAAAVLIVAVGIDAVQYYYTSRTLNGMLGINKGKPEYPGNSLDYMNSLFQSKFWVTMLGLIMLLVGIIARTAWS